MHQKIFGIYYKARLEDVSEGSDSYDGDNVVYYMTQWSATQDTSDRIRRRLPNNGSRRRLLPTTSSSPETSSSGSSVFEHAN